MAHLFKHTVTTTLLTSMKIVCAIRCGSRLGSIDEYDKADIGACGYAMPTGPGFIPGIDAVSFQTH